VTLARRKAALDAHQAWIYFAAMAGGALTGVFVPDTTALDAALTPALAVMLFATFAQMPLTRLGAAWRNGRFVAALLATQFVALPVVVAVLVQCLPADAPMLRLAVYLRLLLGGEAARRIEAAPFLHALFWLIVVPGLLAAGVQILGQRTRTGRRALAASSLLPVPATALVLAVVGTIYTGFATATEAAAFGCLAALLIALGMRRLTWKILVESINNTLRMTGMIFFIVLGAVLYSKFLAITGTPEMIAHAADFAKDNPVLLFLIISIIYLILGMFVDSLGMMLLTIPIFMPLVQDTGYGLIWFGVFVVKWVEIGLITPPVGMNAFVVKGIVGDKVKLGTIFSGLIWFIGVEFLLMALFTTFPEIVTFLPDIARADR